VKRSEPVLVSFFVVLGSLFGAMFTIVAAREMDVDQYALLASSLFQLGIIGLVAGTLQNVSSFDASHYSTKQIYASLLKDKRINTVFWTLFFCSLCTLLLLLCLESAGLILMESAIRFSAVAMYAPAAGLIALAYGRLQGIGKMIYVAGLSAFGAALKILSLSATVEFSVSATSVIWAVTLSGYLVAIIAFIPSRKLGAVAPVANNVHAVEIAVLGLLYWTASGVDLFFLNFALGGEEAGQYAVIATICRFGLIPTIYFGQKSFPTLIHNFSLGLENQQVILRTAKVGIIFISAGAFATFLIGDTIFTLLLGRAVEGYSLFATLYLLSLIPLCFAFPQMQLSLVSTSSRQMISIATLLAITSAFVIVLAKTPLQLLLIQTVNNFILAFVLRSRKNAKYQNFISSQEVRSEVI
jgi:O-antigen/teichoic acid export membrane protein